MLYGNDDTQRQLFALLEQQVSTQVDHGLGRLGMNLWCVVVLAVLKQGVNCDFDRLRMFANHYAPLLQVCRQKYPNLYS